MSTAVKDKPKITQAPPSPGDTRAALAKRKAGLQATIEAETVRRAAATLDGEAFDPSALRAAQDELEAVQGAESEFARRSSAATSATALTDRTFAIERLAVHLKEWLAAIDEQEVSARSMVDAMIKAEAWRANIQALLQDLTGSVPTLLFASEQEMRRCRALSAILFKATNSGNFGEVKLRPGMALADDTWAVAEKALAEHITNNFKEAAK